MAILDYLKRVLTKNVFIAFFIIDLLGFALLGRQLPWFAFPLSLLAGLVVASYQVYAETRAELERLRDAVPHVGVFFDDDGSPTKSLQTTVFVAADNPAFDEIIEKTRANLEQKWEDYEPPVVSESDNLMIRLSRPSREAYDASVSAYLREFRTYMEMLWQFRLIESTIRPYRLLLRNEGSVPAERIIVEILLPHSHLIPTDEEWAWHHFERDDIPNPPDEPDPKVVNSLRALADSFSSISHIAAMDPLLLHMDNDGGDTSSGPTYDDQSRKIRYRLDELIHNLTEDNLEPFLLSFQRVTGVSELKLHVTIHAANLPIPVEDDLTILVKFAEAPPSSFVAP